MFGEYLLFAMRSFRTRQLRSFLTIIGIVIGVASIVALISVGSGLENAITEQFEKIGTNRIYVLAGGFGDPVTRTGLTTKDIDTLEGLSDFEYVTPYLNKNVEVGFGKEEYLRTAFGFPTQDSKQRFDDLDIDLQAGRLFFDGEKSSVVIGSKVAENFFNRELRVGNQLSLNGEKFKIVGIMAPIGSPDDDNAIYVPIDKFREVTDDEGSVTIIELVLKDGIVVEDAVKKIKRELKRARNNDIFEVSTPDQILATFGSILLVIQVVLVGIAGISLLVGAIGILNSMYTSVLERTKEIGIMKAIGARNGDVLAIFLLESGLIAGIGGLIGAALGAGLALLVEVGAHAAGFILISIRLDPQLLIFSVLFAVAIGLASGALPARQASMMKPVDAMRS